MQTFKFQITSDVDLILEYVEHLAENNKNFIYSDRSYKNDVLCIKFKLSFGTTQVKFNENILTIQYKQSDEIFGLYENTIKHEECFISMECKNKEDAFVIFKNFVTSAIKFNMNEEDSKVSIRIYKAGSGWAHLSSLPKRSMDTIYLENPKKNGLISDIDWFYENKELYLKYGIPYKRIYLFEGPPGTGKTSSIFSIASKYNKNIAFISFSQKLDDAEFMRSINSLNDDTILVLEDIDVLFTNREQRTNTNTSSVTFSGLLNTLDGFGRKDNLLIFMTTNYVDKLDAALKRPGRIDYIITFEYPKKEQINEMYDKFLPSQTKYFEDFYKSISNHQISIALLQKFLFANLKCENILSKVPDLIKLINYYSEPQKNLYL